MNYPDDDSVPQGLVLFAPGTPPARKRRRWIFLGFYLCALVALSGPAYLWLAGPHPFVFGMPFALGWACLWMAAMFIALLVQYRADNAEIDNANLAAASPAGTHAGARDGADHGGRRADSASTAPSTSEAGTAPAQSR